MVTKVLLPFILGVFLFPSVWAQKNEPIVVEIGSFKLPSNEFRRIYQRNNSNIKEEADRKTPEEYLQLFINFKLKVLEAQNQGYDTLKAFKTEFLGYRNELAAPYLTDFNNNEKLVEETYRRMTLEVDASHLLISFPENPSPEDTLKAFGKILELKSRIDSGADFNELAEKWSDDPSAKTNRGHLGWFTAFHMVYAFENAAFTTAVGEISPPVRTRFGYHLVKVNDVRPALGEIKVAHIMKMFPADADEALKQKYRKTADSIYTLLKNGADFATLALKLSDDSRSASNGGEMPWFERSRMIPAFADPAFALAENGDFTTPVETDFGFHIIKRLELNPVPPLDEIRTELENRLKRDPERAAHSRELFLERLKSEYNFSRDQETIDRMITHALEQLKDGKFRFDPSFDYGKALFVLKGKEFAPGLFGEFLEKQNFPLSVTKSQIMEKYHQWENQQILNFEDKLLEDKYPEFRSLVQEYYDGLLLFSISEKEIWQKASSDTTGLEIFYEQNKAKYMWGPRVKGMIVRCNSPEIKEQAEKYIEDGIPVNELADLMHSADNLINVTNGTWSKGDHPVIDYYFWDGPKPENWNETDSFIVARLIDPEPKLLDEARGFHISDYQHYIEKTWLAELRKKFPGKINQRVLKKLRNE